MHLHGLRTPCEVSLAAPDAPDAPGDSAALPSCITTAFDQFPSDLGTFGTRTVEVINGKMRFAISARWTRKPACRS